MHSSSPKQNFICYAKPSMIIPKFFDGGCCVMSTIQLQPNQIFKLPLSLQSWNQCSCGTPLKPLFQFISSTMCTMAHPFHRFGERIENVTLEEWWMILYLHCNSCIIHVCFILKAMFCIWGYVSFETTWII